MNYITKNKPMFYSRHMNNNHNGINKHGRVSTPNNFNECVLRVTNMDFKMTKDEWTQLLIKNFSQVANVSRVRFLGGDGSCRRNLVAFVSVANEIEATKVIAKFHHKKIGFKKLSVQLIRYKEDDELRSRVIALLNRLPRAPTSLPVFLHEFSQTYQKRLHVGELRMMRDILDIRESAEGFQMIIPKLMSNHSRQLISSQCMMHCSFLDGNRSISFRKISKPPLRQFTVQVHELLNQHNGCIPLTSFPYCYGALFEPLPFSEDENAVSLEHYISCVKGVKIESSSDGDIKSIVWGTPPTEESSTLSTFGREAKRVLEMESGCIIPACCFLTLYHKRFFRQLRVADYGCAKLSELLHSVPSYIQVLGCGDDEQLTLPHTTQMKRFTSLLRKATRKYPEIPIENLPEILSEMLGRCFHPCDFGLPTLDDLLLSVMDSSEFRLSSTNISRAPNPIQKENIDLKFEFRELLRHAKYFRLPFDSLTSEFEMFFKTKLPSFDMNVEDFIPHNIVQVVESPRRLESFIELNDTEMVQAAAKNISSILNSGITDKNELCFKFKERFGFLLDPHVFGYETIEQLLLSLNDWFDITYDGKIMKSTFRTNVRTAVLHILLNFESLDADDLFSYAYENHCLRLTKTILQTYFNDDLLKFTNNRVEASPSLLFASKVRSILLKRQPSFTMTLDEFIVVYEKIYGPLSSLKFGCLSVNSLFLRISEIVQRSTADTLTLTIPFQSVVVAREPLTDITEKCNNDLTPTNSLPFSYIPHSFNGCDQARLPKFIPSNLFLNPSNNENSCTKENVQTREHHQQHYVSSFLEDEKINSIWKGTLDDSGLSVWNSSTESEASIWSSSVLTHSWNTSENINSRKRLFSDLFWFGD